MLFDLDDLHPAAIYHLMAQTIIPRPIAWVLTDNGVGEGKDKYNLAPFSYFNALASDPPLVMFSCGRKHSDGSIKDTWANIETRKKCVIHIPCEAELDHMVDSAAELPHGESELNRKADYILVEEIDGELPRLASSKIALFCDLDHIHVVGDDANHGIVFCRINHIYVDSKAVKEEEGRIIIDPEVIKPVARLGGNFYHVIDKVISYQRPK